MSDPEFDFDRLLSALQSDAVKVRIEIDREKYLEQALTEFDQYAEVQLSLVVSEWHLKEYEDLLLHKALQLSAIAIPVVDGQREAARAAVCSLLTIRAKIDGAEEQVMWGTGLELHKLLATRSHLWRDRAAERIGAGGSTMQPHEILHKTIHMLLRLAHIRMTKFAKKSGVNRATIYKWMSGDTAPDEELDLLSDVAATFALLIERKIAVEDMYDVNLTAEEILARPVVPRHEQIKARTAQSGR